jgi:hypothetical protein
MNEPIVRAFESEAHFVTMWARLNWSFRKEWRFPLDLEV